MGNTLAAAGTKIRIAIFLALVASISLAVAAFYTPLRGFMSSYTIKYYTYEPKQPVVSLVDTSHMPPGMAVPILMYHGVSERLDDANTTIDTFISHMEMLKREGYQTISVAEYEQWRKGQFVLPPKPIIITFDDGRKDSYYTTDDVFKKLGFKATIFVATGPAYDGNSFYLNWDELRTMKASGRWEIEAHGRYSHHKIVIAEGATKDLEMGRYLTSKMYLPDKGRVETDAEFKKRVEDDYINGLNDLRSHLGVNPHYFAIPLNDYGQQPVSNYPEAIPFNQELIRKYFTVAFIQSNSSDDVNRVHLPVYNYRSDDPYLTKRIEVKNMSVHFLKTILDDQAPRPPSLELAGANFAAATHNEDLFSGVMKLTPSGLGLQAAKANENGQVVFGQKYWSNYTVSAELKRSAGRSVALLFYVKDSRNYMSCGLTDNSYFIRSVVDGTSTDLLPPRLFGDPGSDFKRYSVTVSGGRATCSVDGTPLFSDVPVPVDAGAAGVRVWSNTTKGEGIIRSLEIKPS